MAKFDPAAEAMEGYVVSTVAGFDTPLKARALVRRQDGDFFGGRTPESRAAPRAQMIAADAVALRALAGPIAAAVAMDAVCVFGRKDTIAASDAGPAVLALLTD